ncbi:MAG TPA: hypothetical protein VGF56_13565 [Rhizomicrobium sp.]|jgi:hypothetical protein
MGWTARIVIAIILLLLVGAVVLGLIESRHAPPQHMIEEQVPTPASQGPG